MSTMPATSPRDGSDLRALLRLMTWLSPAFPVGGFAYSGGLERAVADGLVKDAQDLETWIATAAKHGTVWNDAVLVASAHRDHADAERLEDLAALALALAGSAERHQEAVGLGSAFIEAACAWTDPVFHRLPPVTPYAVAVGAIAGAHGVALRDTVAAYLNAFASQTVSAGIRLSLCGQRHGIAVIATVEPLLVEIAETVVDTTLDDLGGATMMADIASLRHETQPVRLFRS